MRIAASALLLVLLSGCFMDYSHGCWEDGRTPQWTEPGAYDRAIAAGWQVGDVDANVPEHLAADLGGQAQWWRIMRHWNDDERLRYEGDSGVVAGIVKEGRSDSEVASMIEAFVWERLGVQVDGQQFLEERSDYGDPFRLFRGQVQRAIDPTAMLNEDGQWVPDAPGSWHYLVGDDAMHVRIPTAGDSEAAWNQTIVVDAADRVQGPYVDGAEVTRADMEAASRSAFAALGWPAPTFQDFASHGSMICT